MGAAKKRTRYACLYSNLPVLFERFDMQPKPVRIIEREVLIQDLFRMPEMIERLKKCHDERMTVPEIVKMLTDSGFAGSAAQFAFGVREVLRSTKKGAPVKLARGKRKVAGQGAPAEKEAAPKPPDPAPPRVASTPTVSLKEQAPTLSEPRPELPSAASFMARPPLLRRPVGTSVALNNNKL